MFTQVANRETRILTENDTDVEGYFETRLKTLIEEDIPEKVHLLAAYNCILNDYR